MRDEQAGCSTGCRAGPIRREQRHGEASLHGGDGSGESDHSTADDGDIGDRVSARHRAASSGMADCSILSENQGPVQPVVLRPETYRWRVA
jgi:hypothetical protein